MIKKKNVNEERVIAPGWFKKTAMGQNMSLFSILQF